MDSDRFEVQSRKDGRIGRGSVYQCYHGKKLVSQVVMDWRPFERILLQQRLPIPGRPVFATLDTRLEPTEKGTRKTVMTGEPTGPVLNRVLVRRMLSKKVKEQFQRDLERFRDEIEAEFSALRSRLPASADLPPDLIGAAAAASLHTE